jgi:hypothetical protein
MPSNESWRFALVQVLASLTAIEKVKDTLRAREISESSRYGDLAHLLRELAERGLQAAVGDCPMSKLSYEMATEDGKKTIDDLPGEYAVKDGRC